MTPTLIITIIGLAEKYGPQVFTMIQNLVNKKDATIADVEAAYAQLKPYSDFGIPDAIPQTAPGPV